MKNLKISFLWTPHIQDYVIYNLIIKLSKKKIEIVSPEKSDLLIIGPYDLNSYKRKIYKSLKKSFFFKRIEDAFPNVDLYLLNRRIKPLRLFYCTEFHRHNVMKADFYISSNLGVADENHLRFPFWKDDLDWSQEGIIRDQRVGNAKRFGSFHSIKKLTEPQEDSFLKKKRDICFFTSHLDEPRRSIYLKFKKNFKIDGYGSFFDKNIKNHNSSGVFKKDIMKNYAFNLCPENQIYPGCFTEKILDAFLGGCLPISFMDSSVNIDFNKESFVNLQDYLKDNYDQIIELLKDDFFLKKFTREPLLLNKPDLKAEILFVEKILENI